MRIRLHVFGVLGMALGAALVSAQPVAAQSYVVVPSTLANVDAVSGNKLPFSAAPARYQQRYSGAEFASVGPGTITEVAFRVDKNAPVFSFTIPNLQVNLSTTAASPTLLSGSYAGNVGADDTIVYSGPLAISASSTPGSVRPFEIAIALTTPFAYDPSAGDLLLDVRILDNTGASVVPFIDSYAAPVIARVFCLAGCSPDDSGGSTDGGFLVTRFAVVPEPSSAAAGGVAALALACAARWATSSG